MKLKAKCIVILILVCLALTVLICVSVEMEYSDERSLLKENNVLVMTKLSLAEQTMQPAVDDHELELHGDFNKIVYTRNTDTVRLSTDGKIPRKYLQKRINVDCQRIAHNDNAYIATVERLVGSYNLVQTDNSHNGEGKCSTYIRRNGYITDPLTSEERDFPIAYSILMYKGVAQVERLLQAIYRPQNIYCVHVDSGSHVGVRQSMAHIASCFHNVFIPPDTVNVTWGHFSVVKAELVCLSHLWRKSKTWKYFINLTGQEFPLRTNYELVRILKSFKGSNHVDISPIHYDDRSRFLKAKFLPPFGIQIRKGSTHVAVSRQFVQFILYNRKVKYFISYLKRTLFPDEFFFSTLNYNPQLMAPGRQKELVSSSTYRLPLFTRYKVWTNTLQEHPQPPCHGEIVRTICIFGTGDLSKLIDTPEMFANKFFWENSSSRLAVECLGDYIRNRTLHEYKGYLSFNASYYGSYLNHG